MKFLSKSYGVTGTLIVLLLIIASQFPIGVSAGANYQDRTLMFFRDVVGLDVTKYGEILISETRGPTGDDSYVIASFDLVSEESEISAYCTFRDNILVTGHLNLIKGSLLLRETAINDLEATKDFLDRYQTHFQVSYIQPLKESLSEVTELKTMEITEDNIKLTVTKDPETPFIRTTWMKTVNGIKNIYSRVGLTLDRNGSFQHFMDNWDLYEVGSSTVKVSAEAAINIAKEATKSYSYKIGNTTVNNLVVADLPEFTWSDLTMQFKADGKLYPHWEIQLPLDKVYPGLKTGVRVTLWADTAEILSIQEVGSLGGPPPEDPSDSTAPDTEPQPASSAYIIAAVTVAAVAVAVAAVALTKRRR